ncbi:MAG: complex I subunit 4 family protein [Acidimicrobiales bacterium]
MLLTLAVFLPVAGAALVALVPKSQETLIKALTLLTTVATAAVGFVLLRDFDYANAGSLQFTVDRSWIDVINSRYHVGIDGLALPLLILSMVVTVLCVIYSWDHFPEPHNPKAFLILLLILETGMNGTFASQDLILFFVFFELVLLPMYFLIGVWGGPNRQYASIKFFLYTLFGSALMILSFLALYFKGGQTFDIPTLIANGPDIVRGTQILIFGGLFMGFAIKVPMFPFHTWLPDAHTEAPTVGSVILAAVLLKLGTYGFVRIALPILPEAAMAWAPFIGALAVIGIIYGALGCLAQKDMKRLIAFSSVAHMGYVMLGISTLTTHGINAAVFGMVAHGLITGMLFFVAGSVGERFGTREISRLGGLMIQAPRMGWILGFCTFASLGLPGLAGFWGEFPAILSAYQPATGLSVGLFRFYMVVAAIGTVFAAGYLLWLFQRVAFGKARDEFAKAHIHDVHGPEYLAWTPLLVAILVFGVFPGLLFDVIDPSVQKIGRDNGALLISAEEAEAAADKAAAAGHGEEGDHGDEEGDHGDEEAGHGEADDDHGGEAGDGKSAPAVTAGH